MHKHLEANKQLQLDGRKKQRSGGQITKPARIRTKTRSRAELIRRLFPPPPKRPEAVIDDIKGRRYEWSAKFPSLPL